MTSTPSDSRAARRRQAATAPAALDAVTLRSPDALVCAIPYLLGFEPRESAVLVWLSRGRILLTQRLDLPGSIDELPAWREAIWSHAAASQSDELIVVVFAAATDLVGEGVSDVIREADARSIAVRDALRVEGDRWWSLLCSDSDCCLTKGGGWTQVTDRVAAEFTLLGRAPLADRSAVAATLDPDPTRAAAVARPPGRSRRNRTPSGVEAWRDAALDSLARRLPHGVGDVGRGPSADGADARVLGRRPRSRHAAVGSRPVESEGLASRSTG